MTPRVGTVAGGRRQAYFFEDFFFVWGTFRRAWDSRGVARALAVLVLQRVEELDLGAAPEHELALLVLGPEVQLGEVATLVAPPLGHPSLANHGVARPHDLRELHRVAPQLRPTGPVGDQLTEETHDQHSRG